YVYVKLPTGTDPAVTNALMRKVEHKVYSVVGENNDIIESIITNVTIGTTDPRDGDQNKYPNRGKIAINFVEFEKRHGIATNDYLKKLQDIKWDLPGADITVNKEQAGPPTAKPISIEVSGDDFDDLVSNKPEIVFDIDRERANREGLSTYSLATEIRGAVYGIEASKFRDVDDEYPIQL